MADGILTIPIPGQPCLGESPPQTDSRGLATFSEFFAGSENRLVEPAVHGVLGCQPTPYNPLVLYGPSGTGKSHLARGLYSTWKVQFPTTRVVYATTVDFARQLADAIESQAVDDFRATYRCADLAVFEDIGEIAAKAAAQDELVQTLDALLDHGGQVIVTSRVAPCELASLLPSLRSRLSMGLTVPLSPPGPDARLAILQQWTRLREVDLADSILQILAAGLAGTVPELLGAMLQMETPARADGRTLDLRTVRRFLSERDLSRQPEIRDIAATTARYFSLKLSDLRGSSRRRPVVIARDVAMFLCRQLTKESLNGVGRYFGGRDHTTVMHACRKTESLQETDPEIRQAIERIKEKIR
jgi:chromosomal replication initiator protein